MKTYIVFGAVVLVLAGLILFVDIPKSTPKVALDQSVNDFPSTVQKDQLPAIFGIPAEGSTLATHTDRLLTKSDPLMTSMYQLYNENLFDGQLESDVTVYWTPILPQNSLTLVITTEDKTPQVSAILFSSFGLIGVDGPTLEQLLLRSMIKMSYTSKVQKGITNLSEAQFEAREFKRIQALQSIAKQVAEASKDKKSK